MSEELSLFDVMYNCRAMRRLDTREVPEEMLFDTQTDPHEMTNVAQRPEMAAIKQRLKKELSLEV